ncbi:MAG: outer membrane protein assembly factor [Vicinamibacterales bacterium]
MRPAAVALCLLALLLFGGPRASLAAQGEGEVRVRSLSFRGLAHVDEARLRTALATRVSSRLPWGRHALFDRSRLEADLKRIQAFYADLGYPDARVVDVDVTPNAAGDAVDIVLAVDEGDPVLVEALRFVGFAPLSAGQLASLERRAPLTRGEPRVRQEVTATRDLALNELREAGYAYARVTVQEDATGGSGVTLSFTADPGPVARFGEIEIAGNRTVSASVIRRHLTFRPGDVYSRSAVQESQRRLYRLELFQFVNLESLDVDRQEPVLRTRVTVVEGNHQRVNFGVGYGTEEKVRVEGAYNHLNFLGGGRSAGVRARHSSLDRGLRLDFLQPYVFHPSLSIGTEAQRWWTDTPAYQALVTGAKVILTRRPSSRMSWAVSWTSENNSSRITDVALADPRNRDELIALGLDPTTNRQEGTLNAVGFDYQRSTADNVLDATRGYQVAFHAERAGRWLPGTFDYLAFSGDTRHYLALGRRFVLANRAQFGTITAANDDPTNVPFAKKYFLGGAASLRGWGRFEVSPLSEGGLPIGGNALLAFSSELRTPLSGSAGGVLFLDAGNVWRETGGVRLDSLRYSTGIGVRYATPVGPIRFDVGYQLNPISGLQVNGAPQLRRWRMHFSIGQAF